eukprot:2673332-Rhodomonas_salina.1
MHTGGATEYPKRSFKIHWQMDLSEQRVPGYGELIHFYLQEPPRRVRARAEICPPNSEDRDT